MKTPLAPIPTPEARPRTVKQKRSIRRVVENLRESYVQQLRRALPGSDDVTAMMTGTFRAALREGLLAGGVTRDLTDEEGDWCRKLALAEKGYFENFRAATEASHEYASTQINLTGDVAKRLMDVASLVNPHAILKRETVPHVTVRYGLTIDDPGQLADRLAGVQPFLIELGDLVIFEKDENVDVLVAAVKSDALVELNKLVGDTCPHTETRREYIPHATVAYVVKGSANSVLPLHVGGSFLVKEIVFSNKERQQVAIPLGVPLAHEMADDYRLGLYAGAVDAAYWTGLTRNIPPNYKIYWRLGLAEHCIDCLKLARESPYTSSKPLRTVPRLGETRCLGNCRCKLEIVAPGFFSSDLGPLIEVTAIGAIQVDPASPVALASASLLEPVADRYATALRRQAGGDSRGRRFAELYLALFLEMKDRLRIDGEIAHTQPEIMDPVYELIASGYRLVLPEDLRPSLEGMEAVFVTQHETIQGRVSSVTPSAEQVEIDGHTVNVGIRSDGLLFVAGMGAG